MKCLLLLLAVELVKCDKLDRSYLPPPGAKYSGGTLDDLRLPLDVPKDTNAGTVIKGAGANNYPSKTLARVPVNQDNTGTTRGLNKNAVPYGLDQSSQLFDNKYQSIPNTNFYGNNFPSKFPSKGYLPSKQSSTPLQLYPVPSFNPTLENIQTTNTYYPGSSQSGGNYYYVPGMQANKNNDFYQIPEKIGSPFTAVNPFSNLENNDYFIGNPYIPTSAAPVYKNQNVQPGIVGYYGGRPMIMASQTLLPEEIDNKKIMTGIQENKHNVPALLNQKKLENKVKMTVKPFQTPLVQSNTLDSVHSINLKPTLTKISNRPHQFPATTQRSFSDENKYSMFDGNKETFISPRFREERPQAEFERSAIIINYENSISPEGYSYSYDTSNGIHADESGTAINGVRAKGSYSYTGDDGQIYTISYTADENGFQPRGDHLPTAPPVPEAIQRVIDQAAKDEAAGIFDDGSYDENKYGHLNYQGLLERYIPMKKSSNRVLRPDGSKRKSNVNFESITRSNIKNDVSRLPVQKQDIQENDTPNFQDQKNKNNEKYIENQMNYQKTKSRNNFKNFDKEERNNQNSKPTTFVTDNPTKNRKKITFPVQKPDLNQFKLMKSNNDIYTNAKMQTPEIYPGSTSSSTLTDDGYYYVPPIIKFSEKAERPAFIQSSSPTTEKSLPNFTVDTESNKRNGFENPDLLKIYNKKVNMTQTPFNFNSDAIESTRKPYISGPDDQTKTDLNENTAMSSNTISKNPSVYELNTTPMTTQIIEASQPSEEYSQYYQTTTNPTTVDQNQPTVVENRVNIPSRKPGITVSQDVVTTTYKPFPTGDEVLEVNQNVKIYGLGKPITTPSSNGYTYNAPNYNNGFYSTTSPMLPIIAGDSGDFYPQPVQETTFVPGIPNKARPYGNDFTTGFPVTDLGVSDPFPKLSLDGQPQVSVGQIPESPISRPNNFEIPEVRPNFIPIEGQYSNGKIIGEDFSGPKQAQKFDPETGYYYK